MKNIYIAFLLLYTTLNYAQSHNNLLVETSANDALVVCGDAVTFTIKVTNRSNTGNVTGLSYRSELPIGIELVSSQFTNKGTDTEIVFDIPDISENSSSVFTYTAKGNCTLLSAFHHNLENGNTFTVTNKNTLDYSIDNGVSQNFSGDSESYNINFPELLVKVKDEDVNLQVSVLEKDADGTVLNREIEVTNSGLGALREYRFYVDFDSAIDFNELRLSGGSALTATGPAITSPLGNGLLRLEYIITDFSVIGDGDDKFEQDEKFIFIDTVSLHVGDCYASMATNYTAVYGCDPNPVDNNSVFCEKEDDKDATSVNYLSFLEGAPKFGLVSYEVVKAGDVCGDTIRFKLKYTNQGTNSSLGLSDTAYDLYFKSSSQIFREAGNNKLSIGGREIPVGTIGSICKFSDNVNAVFSTDPDGLGVGLDDIDKDGVYDDLPAGATLVIDVELNMEWNSTFFDDIYISDMVDVSLYAYTNSCTGNVISPGKGGLDLISEERVQASDELPQDLTTGDSSVLKFNVFYNYLLSSKHQLDLFGHQNSGAVSVPENYLSRFILPEGYKIDRVTWHDENFDGSDISVQELNWSQIGNNEYEVLGGNYRGRYEVEVTVDCVETLVDQNGVVNWEMYRDMCNDFSSLELLKIAATNSSILTNYLSCSGVGETCDLITSEFEVQRNTFGYIHPNSFKIFNENELKTQSLVTAETPGIKLDAAYPTDKILISALGVLSTEEDEIYNEISFTFSFDLPEGTTPELLVHKDNGILTVGNSTFPLTSPQISIEETEEITNKVKYTYNVSVGNVSGQAINLEVSDLQLQFGKLSDIGLARGVYELTSFKAFFSGKNIDGKSGCGNAKGANFDLYIPQFRQDVDPAVFLECYGEVKLATVYLYSATGNDDFNKEYRPITNFSEIGFVLPEGYQLKEETSSLYSYSSFYEIFPYKYSMDEEVIGDTVNLLKSSMPAPSADSGFRSFEIYSSVEPICEDDIWQDRQEITSIMSYVDILENPEDIINFFDFTNENPVRTVYNNYNGAKFSTAPNVVQEGFERFTDWPVQMCNTSTSSSNNRINNPWMAFELKPLDKSTILVGANDQNGNLISQDNIIFYGPINPRSGTPQNMLVKVSSSISKGGCVTISPIAEYRVCENDVEQDIDLISSWACDTFPFADSNIDVTSINSVLDAGILQCQFRVEQEVVTLRYKTGDLDWEVNRLQDEVELCETTDFEIKVVSSKYANVYDTNVSIDLPEGVTVSDINQLTYTYNGSTNTVVPTTFVQQNISATEDVIIDASGLVTSLLVASGDLDNASESTIPGIRLPGKNEITFKVSLISDCDYNPGQAVNFNLKGTTNCSENISLAYGRFIPIKGLVLPDIAIDILADDFLVCDDFNEVSIKVKNNNEAPIAQQQLVLTLPLGVSYENTVVGFPEPSSTTATTVSWDLLDLELSSDQIFKVNTRLSLRNNVSFKYSAETIQNGQATCISDNQLCDLKITTAQDFVEVLNTPFPEITINPISSIPICEGEDVVVEVLLTGNVNGGAYTYNWNVNPISSSGNKFTFNPLNSGRLEVTVQSVSNTSANCSGVAGIDIDVYPGAVLKMELVEGVSCADQADGQVTLTIVGEQETGFVDQAPFELIDATYPDLVTIGQQLNDGQSLTIANLPEGDFSVTFKDNYGCTFEKSITVPKVGSPIGDFCTTLLSCGATSGGIELYFSTLDVHAAITGTNYTGRIFNASSGSNEDILTFTGTFTDTQTHELTDVATTSVYVLEIVSENGCTYSKAFRPQALQVFPRITNATGPEFYELCFSNQTRDIALDISNNINQCSDFQIAPYTVLFGLVDDNQEFTGDPQVFNNVASRLDLNGVGVGSYKVSVIPSSIDNYNQDITSCGAELFFEITSQSKFTAEIETVDPKCFGAVNGAAHVIISGGSGAITYEWQNVSTGEIVSIGYNATGLPAGDYQLVVADESGCGSVDPLTFTLQNPKALEIPIIEDIQTSCDAIAGSGLVGGIVSGYSSGTAPYVFSWYKIVDQQIIVADSDPITEQVPVLVFEEEVALGETSSYTGIKPANYKVVITDSNGCTTETIVTAVTQPPVARNYNLCLSWESPIIRETEPPLNDEGRKIPPLGPSDFREAIAANVERCVNDSKAQLEANVDAAINDVDSLEDEVLLKYNQGVSDVYHFTLYYYDRAGNLVRTVSPEGVQTVSGRVATEHAYVTGYDYNSISQLTNQKTPDGGSSQFMYNDIGQLLYSQNERQLREQVFSYVIYDELGRVREGGEAALKGKTLPNDFLINDQANPQISLDISETDKLEFIQTTYNDCIDEITYLGQKQRFLRNNVSFINNKDKNGKKTKTYYSYDPHGNVEWCIQELPGIGRTTVAYTYDLISGNVNEVHFNKGKVGEYRHRYTYDEDNRIVSVKTSKDGYIWDEDAQYDYYLHGPLMRTEIGEDKIQGLDFTYTIHGWLKGINTPNLEQNAFNPDGSNTRGDIATKHAKDEFGMALGYYQGDFTRNGVINSGLTTSNPFNLQNQVNGVQQNLYNGNISTWTSQVAEEAKEKNRDSYITANAYRYDQLNRIKSSTTQLYSDTNQSFGSIGGNADAFSTSYSYDKNGNLQTLKRHKEDGQLMDDLEYHYNVTNPNFSNQLNYVNDNVGQISAEINDLPNQAGDNYEYDETGQLIRDNSEGLTYVWTAAGKVSEIIPDNTNDPDTQKVYMSFTYDGMGIRAVKQVNRMPYNAAGEGPQIHNPAAVETTYYSTDASGNVMGIYKREDVKANPNVADDHTYTATFSITERPIYGSDRVGQDVYEEVIYTRTYGFETLAHYEEIAVEFMDVMTNALGNVLLVQNNDQELTDANGNAITIAATTVSKAKADKAFNALIYEAQQGNIDAVLPINTDNNIILVEDSEGETISYGMVANNYFSTDPDRSVLLLYNAQGQLVPGLELINDDANTPIDPQAKTVVVRHPSNPTEYLLFYRDTDAGLHCANLRNSGGLTITKHQDFAYSNYGRHMAVIQNEQQKIAYLYATMHSAAVIDDEGTVTSPAGINLVRFTIDEGGVATFDSVLLPEYFESFDADGNGELQIAVDGSAISIYHNTSLPAQWTGNADAEIRTWQLNEETRLPVIESVTTVAVANGNIGKGSLINTGDEIYYTQYTQEVSTSTDNKVVKRASDGQVVTTNGLGDLRMNKDNKLYQFASTTDSGQEWNLETQTVTALNNLPASTSGSTGYQPYQPYTILKQAEEATEGIVYRNVGNKYYELKDHLGNVRVVVGDRKNLDPATGELTASVESYNNYYPFGMLQPNRHKDSKSYRYGFQ
ncbi:hypothetical protein Q4566_16230, partial [Tamlana sp. 2_MG-2023]|uniref:hypothetical protein n=1 Tax=unclassified Tamlana TaxID=2614803 RepID=UPI0026E310C9